MVAQFRTRSFVARPLRDAGEAAVDQRIATSAAPMAIVASSRSIQRVIVVTDGAIAENRGPPTAPALTIGFIAIKVR